MKLIPYEANRTKISKFTCIAGVLISLFTAYPAIALDIEDIYKLAKGSDHVIRKAKMARAGTQEAVQQSNARYWPTISASTFYTQNSQNRIIHNFNNTDFLKSKPEYDISGYTVSLTQSLFNYDAIIENKQARATYELADIQYNDIDQKLVLRVITAYMGVLAATQEISFRQLEVAALKKQLEQTEYRLNLGISAKIDVSESKAGYDQSLARLTTAGIRLAIANETLRVITVKPHENLDPLSASIPIKMPNPNNLASWINMAHRNNYRLQASEQQLEIARIGIKRQGSSRLPNLSLIATYNYYNDLELDYAGVEFETGSITARLNWNLYQGGLISSRIRQAKYYKQQIEISLQQQKSFLDRQVRDAYYILVGGVNRIGELEQSIKSQMISLEANKAGYEAGSRTSFDVLNARTNLYSLRRKLAQARHDYVVQHAILKYRAGTLNSTDLENINQHLE